MRVLLVYLERRKAPFWLHYKNESSGSRWRGKCTEELRGGETKRGELGWGDALEGFLLSEAAACDKYRREREVKGG